MLTMRSARVESGRLCPRCSAFTLVELLVVIGIIALLMAILLPVLSKARSVAQSAACKSLLRQYAYASMMYCNDNKGVAVDSHRFLDYDVGLPRYMGNKAMSEKIARCPGDHGTEAMNRLGLMGAGVDPADPSQPWPLRRADGTEYAVWCSIGCNQNSISASRRRTSKGYGEFWVRPSKLRIPGADPTQTMIWSDWQNNPRVDSPLAPIVTAGASGSTEIGSLCFRHNGVANAAFLDGHVGELVPTVRVAADGHALAAPWPTWTGFAEGSYPWAPRNNGGTYGIGITVDGQTVPYFPGIRIR